ncbi:MAG: hypothetical protein U0163_05855 [Gemmatimonadaceae bacterium]
MRRNKSLKLFFTRRFIMIASVTSSSAPDAPAEPKLATFQAARLSRLTGVSTRRLIGESLGSLVRTLPPSVDRDLLDALPLSGRVVVQDRETGRDVPVPFATVQVEDTDCQLLGYFPQGWPWSWYFPLCCRREVIAQVVTDADGCFTVRVPRFDIDWILRWRWNQLRHSDLFTRVSIPATSERHPFAHALRVGAAMEHARRASLEPRHATPRSSESRRRARAELPAPLPTPLLSRYASGGQHAVLECLAAHLDVSPRRLDGFNLDAVIGPFERHHALSRHPWLLLTDVPDITFRVTAAIGDTQHAVYSDANFDVRWSANALPSVTLVAAVEEAPSLAFTAPHVPRAPEPRPRMVGLAPLLLPGGSTPPSIDSATGYAHQSRHESANANGAPIGMDAAAPFAGTLQLYGDVRIPGAEFYRVLRSTDQGRTFEPFVGLSWPIFRATSGALTTEWTTTDVDGWYRIPAVAEHWFPNTLLLEWPQVADGTHLVCVECADRSRHTLARSPVRTVVMQGLAPHISYGRLCWKFASEPDSALEIPSRNLLVPCPSIRRRGRHEAIQIVVEVEVSPRYFRYASLGASGCGEGDFVLAEDDDNRTSHWYADATDHTVTLRGRFQLDAGAAEGAYSFNVYSSRWPQAGDGHEAAPAASSIYTSPTIPVAVRN